MLLTSRKLVARALSRSIAVAVIFKADKPSREDNQVTEDGPEIDYPVEVECKR